MDKPTPIKDSLRPLPQPSPNVTNVNKIINNVNNVDELSTKELIEVLENKFFSEKEAQTWLAKHLAEELDNLKDLNYFKEIVTQYDRNLLLECLIITLAAKKEGGIKKPGAYFVGVLRKKKPP